MRCPSFSGAPWAALSAGTAVRKGSVGDGELRAANLSKGFLKQRPMVELEDAEDLNARLQRVKEWA